MTHPADAILKTKSPKIMKQWQKRAMAPKQLFRVVQQSYADFIPNLQSKDMTISVKGEVMLKKKMAELIYENLLHKYGLKNFAEKKFTEVSVEVNDFSSRRS